MSSASGSSAEGAVRSYPERSSPSIADLDEFYRSQSRRLMISLAQQTGCRETAREIAHEAFARFFGLTSRQRFAIERPEAYLRRISTNLVRDWSIAQSRQRAKLQHLEDCAPANVDQLARLESRDLLRRVEAAIERLKPKTRAIFLAHRLDGLSYAEIAAQTGLSIKGVEKQMSKAIAKLDRLLAR